MRPACSAFSALQAFDLRAVLQPKLEATLLELSVSFRAQSPGPRAVPAGYPVGVDDTSSRGLFLPYGTCRPDGPVCRRRIPPPPRATSGVWLPPSRPTPSGLPVRLAHRSAPGLHPPRCSPRRDRFPSRGPCHPAVTRSRIVPKVDLRSAPPSWRCSHDESVRSPEPEGSGRRYLLEFRSFRACSRSSWRPLWYRGASPLALGRLDVQARLGHRVLRMRTSGTIRLRISSSLGLPYLPTSQCTVRRSSGRAYGFASRRRAMRG